VSCPENTRKTPKGCTFAPFKTFNKIKMHFKEDKREGIQGLKVSLVRKIAQCPLIKPRHFIN
jgi:hypothetical protein